MRLVLLTPLLFRPAFAQAPPDAAEILKKVAAVYQGASEYEFVLDVLARDDGRDQTIHTLFAFKPPNRNRMEGAFPGMASGPGEAVAANDGVNLWYYMPKENQYAAIPVSELTPDAPGELGDARADFMDAAFRAGFSMIASQRQDGQLLREESVAFGGGNVDCYVIGGKLDGQDGTLWVDKRRYLILRMEAPDATITFTTAKVNEPLPDALFKFEIPVGAMKIELPRRP